MSSKKLIFFLTLAIRKLTNRGKNPFFNRNYSNAKLTQRLTSTPLLPKKKLCFLLGCGRSGTTLLSDCLSINKNILAEEELHIAPAASAKALFDMYYGDPLAMYLIFGYFHTLEQITGLSREEVKRLWFEMVQKDISVAEMYGYLHQQSNGRIILDKTPLLPLYGQSRAVLKDLLVYEPVFIYLVRNPLSVISSFQKMFLGILGQMDIKKKTNPKIYPDHWHYFKSAALESKPRLYESVWFHSNSVISDFVKELPPHQVYQLTFENFLQDPESHLKQICQKLEIDYDPEMTQVSKKRKPVYSHQDIAKMVWEYNVPVGDLNRLWSAQHHHAINPGRAQSKDHQWRQLQPATQALAQSFGYHVTEGG